MLILKLGGYQASKGINIEKMAAINAGISVDFVEYDLD